MATRTIRFGIRAKLIGMVICIASALSLLIGLSIYAIVQDELLAQLKSKLLSTVTIGADALDAQALERLVSAMEGEDDQTLLAALEGSGDYAVLSEQLNKIRDTDPVVIRYVYTFAPTGAPDVTRFVVDADVLAALKKQAAGEDIGEVELSHLGSVLDVSGYEVAKEVLARLEPAVEDSYVYDELEKINSISGYAPVFGSDGRLLALLGVDMADTDARNALAKVTRYALAITAAALALSAIVALLMGKLFTRDIHALKGTVERFALQDFEARASIKARDEIGNLADSFNDMAQTIVDYQGKIAAAEREKAEAEYRIAVESAKNAENRKYLDNITQGLLLMDADCSITGQYSKSLARMFKENAPLEGMRFVDFVYPDREKQAGERKELEMFLSVLMSNTTADADMIDSVNPFKDCELTLKDGSRIVVDGRFLRVASGDLIENIMVVFEDKTDLRAAERSMQDERDRYDAELEAIASILKNGPLLFDDFLRDGEALMSEFSEENIHNVRTDRLHHYFRQFHSLKGTAHSLKLRQIAKEAHVVEDLLAELRAGRALLPADEAALESSLDRIASGIENVRTTMDSFMAFGAQHSAVSGGTELDAFVASLRAMTEELGDELGKAVDFTTRIEFDKMPFMRELKGPIIHLIRNSMDHGLEGPFERAASGKPEHGRITLELRKNGAQLELIVRDDGKGIDFRAVRKAAVRKGIMGEDENPDRQRLVNILFSAGFSSRDAVNDVSGRGVGLDAVAQAVKVLGGTLKLQTRKNEGTSFILLVPLRRVEDFS